MEYLKPLIRLYQQNADPVKAEAQKKYLKDLFPFIGLSSQIRRDLQKTFYSENRYPDRDELFPVVFALWDMPEREYQHTALELLRRYQKKLVKNDIVFIEKLLVQKSWWDTVDGLAAWICGSYFKLFPEMRDEIIEKWMQSGNFWLQRTCLIFQLHYKEDTDTFLLENIIPRLADEKEFFIRKAIGWILRQYSKTNPSWVSAFVERQPLSGLSYREATKYI